MDSNLQRLRERMEKETAAAFLVSKDENRRYLSGFSGSAGYLLITSQDNFLITDFRYATQAVKEARDWRVVIPENETFIGLINLISKLKIKSLAFEKHVVTVSLFEKLKDKLLQCELKPVEGWVEELRKQKSEAELELLRKAGAITGRAFEDLRNYSLLNRTEREVAHLIEELLWKNGSERVAFPTIVATGPHGALPHATPRDKPIQAGELLVMDFGAVVNGYCSDITRTVAVGSATERQMELYQMVLTAQLNALAKVKAGISCQEADRTARTLLEQNGYGEYFGHGLGHGVGLEIHEEPRLSPLTPADDLLCEGMVVTVEPGIYFPEWGGIRIEDTVIVHENGCEILTLATKDFLVFE